MKHVTTEEFVTAVRHDGSMAQVPKTVMDIVNEIHDRWPELQVRYTESTDLDTAPFIIVDIVREQVVLKVWELTSQTINMIHLMDSHNVDLQALFKAEEEKARKDKAYKDKEVREEKKDMLKHIFDSPKTSYKFKNDQGEIVEVSDG